MSDPGSFIRERLQQRVENDSLRSLNGQHDLADFCSNDYLGFARSPQLKKMFVDELTAYPNEYLGSTGSRLISGNHPFTEKLEAQIAEFHRSESGLIFNSGYDANVGLFSSLPQRGDTIITDELIHASIIDGARLSHANRFVFRHNDIESLQQKLSAATGKIYIAVESVYSMDGDEAPLAEIANLAQQYNAALIVDEAHATGIFGTHGSGLVDQHHLNDRVFARVVTFGKALGAHGAIVLGTDELRSYLLNFARPFIYSTAAPFFTHLSVGLAYDFLQQYDHQQHIASKINLFKAETLPIAHQSIPSNSAIQSIVIGGNQATKAVAERLKKDGFNVKAILHPTVSEGKERLRICLHTFNTDHEITRLARLLNTII